MIYLSQMIFADICHVTQLVLLVHSAQSTAHVKEYMNATRDRRTCSSCSLQGITVYHLADSLTVLVGNVCKLLISMLKVQKCILRNESQLTASMATCLRAGSSC